MKVAVTLQTRLTREFTKDPTQKWLPKMSQTCAVARAKGVCGDVQVASKSKLAQVICVRLSMTMLRSHYVRFSASRSML